MVERFIPSDADIASRCRARTYPGSYMILPRANRVESVLPGFEKGVVQVLTTPGLGARFVQHELHLQPGGGTRQPLQEDLEQFLYVLEGELTLTISGGKGYDLTKGGFAYLPEKMGYRMKNPGKEKNRVLWLRRQYVPTGSSKPDLIVSHEKDIPALPCDTYLEQHLLPHEENIAYDMAFNLLNFEPGIHFGFVESHIMEHGLYMLDGRGIYWLNGNLHEVQADDFIYMAPFCPQFFYAIGWVKGRYLVYKDVNRDYTSGV